MRRTTRTGLSALSVRPEVAEFVLGHTLQKIATAWPSKSVKDQTEAVAHYACGGGAVGKHTLSPLEEDPEAEAFFSRYRLEQVCRGGRPGRRQPPERVTPP